MKKLSLLSVLALLSLFIYQDPLNAEAEFMGGTMEMAEGGTAYFHVALEPGDYAWIAEIPDPADHNMLKPFTITEESNSEN